MRRSICYRQTLGNKDRWVIDSGCSQHISSNRKMFSSHTSVQERNFHGKFRYKQVFKEAHVMFQVGRVGNVYMLQNSEVTVGGL